MRSDLPPLLLFLSHARDPQRFAVGPALAAAAERSGWSFECYYDDLRRGRHWGSGEPRLGRSGWASGSLVSGGRHVDQLLWLATGHRLVALGDPDAALWPALEAMGAETLACTTDPATLYRAAFERLGLQLPSDVVVMDGQAQGRHGLVVSPYLYPRILAGPAVLAVDVSAGASVRTGLERLGSTTFHGWYLDPGRAAAFPGELDGMDGEVDASTYADLTATLADDSREWGRGVLLGDPDLVGAQLPKARRLRLLPLYGSPQTDVIARASSIVQQAAEPVFGRQFGDEDFFAISRLGHGFQILDPDPPFDAAIVLPRIVPKEAAMAGPHSLEPSDEQLSAWADDGRVLVTVVFWSGMLREIDLMSRLVDLVAATDLRAGLAVTAETVEHAGPVLGLLGTAPERGGVAGRLELLLASTGRGVAPEALLPAGALAPQLVEARSAVDRLLAPFLRPRGWWPLLDTPLEERRPPRMGWERERLKLRAPARGRMGQGGGKGEGSPRRKDLRGVVGGGIRRFGLDRFMEERRPYDHLRPGPFDLGVATAVRESGLEYMWTKAAFGTPAVQHRHDRFVALPFTAGNWDGWTPFYTLGSHRDVERAERHLLGAGHPGWLASTVDSPLFAMSGEVLEHGRTLYRLSELVAAGGRSGRLVNVTPGVVARYARLLDDRNLLGPPSDRAATGPRS